MKSTHISLLAAVSLMFLAPMGDSSAWGQVRGGGGSRGTSSGNAGGGSSSSGKPSSGAKSSGAKPTAPRTPSGAARTGASNGNLGGANSNFAKGLRGTKPIVPINNNPNPNNANNGNRSNVPPDTGSSSPPPPSLGEVSTATAVHSTIAVPSASGSSPVVIDVIRGDRGTAGVLLPAPRVPSEPVVADGNRNPLPSIDPAHFENSSINDLSAYLEHSNPRVQGAAVQELLERGVDGRSALVGAAQSPTPRVRSAGLLGLSSNPSPGEVELIVDAIRDPNVQVQRVAIRVAGLLGVESRTRTQAALLESLDSDDPETRSAGTTALANLGPEVIPELVTLLAARREATRDAAGKSLVKFGEPAVAPLVTALKDERVFVRYWAAYALGEIGRPSLAALPLLEAMAKSDPDSTVKFYAQTAARKLTR